MIDEHVRVLEGRRQSFAERTARRCGKLERSARRVLPAERTLRVAAIGTARGGHVDRSNHGISQRRQGATASKLVGIEAVEQRLAMQAGNKMCKRKSLLQGHVAGL